MKKTRDVVIRFLPLVALLILWQVGSMAMQKELFLPSPLRTLQALHTLVSGEGFWMHLWASFRRVTLAVLITGAVSIPLGMAIAFCKPVNLLLYPVVKSLRFLPVTVFSSLLVLFLGIDEAMKVTFLVIATLFSFLPAVIQTCNEVDGRLLETAHTMGFSYTRTVLHVVFPYILPSVLGSLITLYGVGWTFVIIAELTNAQWGLGHLIYINSARGRTPMVFATIVVIVLVSFVFDKAANLGLRKAFAWRYENE